MEWYLPVIWAGLIGTAVMLYVVLDGFDLGIAILFPTTKDEGERDQMISPDLGAQFCDDIPRCRLVTFPKLGHLPQEEDPDSTLKALEPFLAS